mmetsp:Transcript_53696/g.123034  ORF Transcript_53696/g.123034 Transcript_53696/m.123034 type:complete len:240 (+) Transcript_53696:1579-2298(+)
MRRGTRLGPKLQMPLQVQGWIYSFCTTLMRWRIRRSMAVIFNIRSQRGRLWMMSGISCLSPLFQAPVTVTGRMSRASCWSPLLHVPVTVTSRKEAASSMRSEGSEASQRIWKSALRHWSPRMHQLLPNGKRTMLRRCNSSRRTAAPARGGEERCSQAAFCPTVSPRTTWLPLSLSLARTAAMMRLPPTFGSPQQALLLPTPPVTPVYRETRHRQRAQHHPPRTPPREGSGGRTMMRRRS